MNDIVSFLALAGLWLPLRRLTRSDWGDLIRTGVRVVATWGPRDPYADRRDAAATPASEPTREHTAG